MSYTIVIDEVHEVEVTAPPKLERAFRDAWVLDGTAIKVDMPMAREIWRDKIRKARAPVLEQLDAEFMRALETSAQAGHVVARKQALRDAPQDPAIDSAKTPAALLRVQPAGLTIMTWTEEMAEQEREADA